MDYTVLSNWHSASRGESIPLIGVFIFDQDSSSGIVSIQELRILVQVPNADFFFRGIFGRLERGSRYLVIEDQDNMYWRVLTEQEYQIIEGWWRNHPSRQDYPDRTLRCIEECLQTAPSRTSILFRTRNGRLVQVSKNSHLNFFAGKWREIHNRRILAKAAEDACRFWIVTQGTRISGSGMSRQTFFAYITPTGRRAS